MLSAMVCQASVWSVIAACLLSSGPGALGGPSPGPPRLLLLRQAVAVLRTFSRRPAVVAACCNSIGE